MMATNSGRVDPSGTPGFRFYPTEEELLGFYLRHRLAGSSTRLADVDRVIPVVDVYAHHPSDLRSMAGEASARDTEQWFFFCPERVERGGRPARTTPSGYWKATGSPCCVFSSSSSSPAASTVIGVKRTMVFYQGRAPTGTKTNWKMNEYKATAVSASAAVAQPTACAVQLRNELSVCRVYVSTGTLRSFDRRPLNPPSHYQAAPLSAITASTSLAAAGTGQKTDNSRDSCSSGSRGIAADDDADGYEDAAIDWDSLITTTADEFSFGNDGFNYSGTVAWPQI